MANETRCGRAGEAEKNGANPSGGHAIVDAQPPILPRPRMPLAQRAKIFIPFDPLKGYQEALREKEREAEIRMNERAQIEDPS